MFRLKGRSRIFIPALIYAVLFVLPVLVFIGGWVGWDTRIGMIYALYTFGVLFVAGGALLWLIEDLHIVFHCLPLAFGLVGALLPDFYPGPLDNAAVMLACGLLTLAFWLRRKPDLPRWVAVGLVGPALYALPGRIIPTRIDEVFIFLLGTALAAYGIWFYKPEALVFTPEELAAQAAQNAPVPSSETAASPQA